MKRLRHKIGACMSNNGTRLFQDPLPREPGAMWALAINPSNTLLKGLPKYLCLRSDSTVPGAARVHRARSTALATVLFRLRARAKLEAFAALDRLHALGLVAATRSSTAHFPL